MISDDTSGVDSAAAAHELLARLFADRERGEEHPLEHYQALFPGHEELVARELTALQEDQPAGDRSGAQRFGRYRILEELGRGGQGVVYLAEDPELHRKVAIKVLAGAVGLSSDASLRFRREAEAASRLDHPGICTVYEAGETEGTPYIAMRYVRGVTLRDQLAAARRAHDSGSTPTGSETRAYVLRVVRLVEDVARALHHAHEQGLVHRDIKPGNVLVAAGGDPVVLDFGLVRDQASDGEGLTASGDLLGTPAYLSPEQLRERPGAVDRRTDVYSLGATLFECLALRRPFEAPTREALYRQILTEAPPDVTRFNRHVPAELKVVVETALEKDRDRRYRTALDLAEDLRRVRERQPIRARPAGPALRARRWVQRNPAPSVALVLLVVGLVVAGLLLLRGNTALRQSRAIALAAASAEVQEKDALLALQLAREAVGMELMPYTVSQLHRALPRPHERARLAGHSQYVYGVSFPDGHSVLTWSGDGTARLWSLAGEELARYSHAREGAQSDLRDAAVSPDGSRVVTASVDGTARLWSRDGTRLAEMPHAANLWSATFSPDGQAILTTAADGGACIWDVQGQLVQALSGHDGDVHDGAFSPDGRWIVTASADGTARVWERVEESRWAERRTLGGPDGHVGPVWRASFSPDGGRILTFSSNGGFPGGDRGDHTARLWSRSGALLAVLPHDDMIWSAEFSPVRDEVLTASADGTAVIWRLDERGRIAGKTTYVVERNVQSARFSPSGERILLTGASGLTRVYERSQAPFVARPTAVLAAHASWVFAAAFSPDGRYVAAGAQDGTTRLWDVGTGELPVLLGHRGQVSWVDVSQRWIATVSTGGQLRLWDREGALQWEKLHPEPGERLWRVAISAGGDRLVVLPSRGPLAVWSVQGTRLAELEPPNESGSLGLAFSPDGDELLVTTSRAVSLYDATGVTPVWIRDLTVQWEWLSAVFSPSSDRILTASWKDGATAVWSKEGEVLEELRHGGYVNHAVFSPGGERILTASTDKRAYLWDPERGPRDDDGRLLPAQVFVGHEDRVATAEFSPDGRLVVTASGDDTARLWTADGEPLAVYRGHSGAVTRAVFTPDGARVLTSSVDGTVRTWIVDTGELLELADRRLAGRGMTPAQQARFAELLGR